LVQAAITEQLTAHAEVLKSEREKIVLAVAANGRLEKLTAHRILLGLILSYIAGLVTIPVVQYIISFLGPMFTGLRRHMYWLNPACPQKWWWSSEGDETAYLSAVFSSAKLLKVRTRAVSSCPIMGDRKSLIDYKCLSP
jgi:hypothetical protein